LSEGLDTAGRSYKLAAVGIITLVAVAEWRILNAFANDKASAFDETLAWSGLNLLFGILLGALSAEAQGSTRRGQSSDDDEIRGLHRGLHATLVGGTAVTNDPLNQAESA